MSRTLLFVAGLAAALLAALGSLSFMLYTFWPVFERGQAGADPGSDVIAAAELAVLGVLGAGLGFGLLWHVRRDWQDQRSAPFRISPLSVLGALLLFPF